MKRFYLLFLSLATLVLSCGEKDDSTASSTNSSTTTSKQTVAASNLFRLLSPEESGIPFVNSINEVSDLHYYRYGYLYNGGGVAVGDINQDGLPDIYVSGTMVQNRLYLNKGDLKFEDITESAGLTEMGQYLKTGVAMADINADGLLDIFVSRSGPLKLDLRRNLVYINQGDQTFKEAGVEMGLGAPCNTSQAGFFDMDGDGDLDCYMMNHPTRFGSNSRPRMKPTSTGNVRITTPEDDYESDRLFRNNGNGTFTDVSKAAGINNSAFGLGLTIADFNGDNHLDIFVGNDFVEPDFLYINDGRGKFTDQYEDYFRHSSQNSMGSDLADLNNDGHSDLVVLDMLPDDPQRQKAMMSTMMLDRYELLLDYGYGRQQMRNVLQANNGDGSFSEIGQLAGIEASDWSWAPILADLDNDGLKDIYLTNGFMRDVTDLDFLKFRNDSLRKELTKEDLPALLARIPQHKLRNHLYHNLGDFQFEEVGRSWGTKEATFSNGAVAADLDGDGDLELIINNIDDPVSIYENTGAYGNKSLQLKLVGPTKNPFATGAEAWVYTGGMTQRQLLNPIRGYLSSQDPLLHFGLGSKDAADSILVRWPDGKTTKLQSTLAGLHELNYAEAGRANQSAAKGKALLSSADIGIDFSHRENSFEDFKRERLLTRRLSREGPCMASGDIDGDGKEDLFIGGAAGQSGQLFLQSGNGKFRFSSKTASPETEDVAAAFLDANGDGKLDLYVVSGGYAFKDGDRRYQDRLYLNDGSGKFSVSQLPKKMSPGGAVAIQDWDRDGDMDVFVGGFAKPGAYPTPTRSYFFQNDGSGVFTDVSDQLAPNLSEPGIVSDARWADLDKDGKLELLLCGEWMPITVYSFNGDKFSNTTSKHGLEGLNGWWNSLTLFDADKDGDLDIMAGNLGGNSRFRATQNEPLSLYAKDFDGNGSIDPVLFQYTGGRLRPWASKDLLLSQLPGLKKNFLRYNKYARAGLDDIFSPAERQGAMELKCQELENCVFLNEGGRFSKGNLPNMAQAFPVQDAVANDFNGDGLADLLLVGNNYHMDVETGPITAGHGLLLLGDGKGGFEVLGTSEAGLNAIGDARAVQAFPQKDGKWSIVIGMNDGKTATFIR